MAPELLDCIAIIVPAEAMETYEAALGAVCRAVSFFHDEDNDLWDIQGVKERGAYEDELSSALAVAEMLTGYAPEIIRSLVPVGGWLARTKAAFPEQTIGKNFVVRGTHINAPAIPGRITLTLDAGLAFGTGEHNSTRGCLVALERIARYHHPTHILDLGTGSGVLAIAAAKLMKQSVLATDIDPRAARVAGSNAKLNGVANQIRSIKADGWMDKRIQRAAPYDLVFANILARPLCAMAHQLAQNLKPGGIAILAGLLTIQANWVLSAHRRAGLVLDSRIIDGAWTTLILRQPNRL
ncbi:MAG: 50S ribosomal protein L11 methyltransferase [Acidocella sp.]|nr:50S ribosomal protein L11 methyltransferase [Acidocella sp.]OYY05105.1 MAG: 50S ribosomal protein L11 methyltransferase [Acidocella sp. 35-58-6]